MSDYTKARVLLINEETGEMLTELEIITSSREVLYSNSNPTTKRIGNIPEGSTFENVSVGEILDNILYPYKEACITKVYLANDDASITNNEPVDVYKQTGSIVEPTILYADVLIGSAGETKGIVNIHREDGTIEVFTMTVKAAAGFLYKFAFELSSIDVNSKIEFIVDDGVTSYSSPFINYHFVDPIYVGWCDPDMLTNGKISDEDITEIKSYFEDKISVQSETLETRFSGACDQRAMLMNVDYTTHSRMSPCILIPSVYGHLTGVVDLHGLNIISTYTFKNIELLVTPNRKVSYNVYISKEAFFNDNAIIGEIIYTFKPNVTNVNPSTFSENGVPILAPFDMMVSEPIDCRSVVDTYEDLVTISNPYDGLITFVKEKDMFYKYYNGSFKVFSIGGSCDCEGSVTSGSAGISFIDGTVAYLKIKEITDEEDVE